jgi:hypothetical protein
MGAPGFAIGELRFLYVGVADTTAALAFYTEHLGARQRWRFRRFGADVAGLELGSGPLVLLADHRPVGTVLPIYAVDDLALAVEQLRAAGAAVAGPMGTPEGDAILVEVPTEAGGPQELALLEVVRPDALDGAFTDPDNDFRVQTTDPA